MAGTYVEGKHDLGLLRQDGSIKWGFYLATDPRTKQPLFRSYYDDFLSTRIYNGDPGYNQLTPEKEFSIRQDSWEAGFGQHTFSSTDPKRYSIAFGADLRFKNMAINGPQYAYLSSPTHPAAVVNGTCEAATTWTNGTRDGAQNHTPAGAFSWAVTAGVTAYQNITWSRSYQGKAFTLTAWVFQTAGHANEGTISINDGVGTTTSSTSATEGSWVQLTVTRTLDSAATQLRVQMTKGALVGTIYFDDFVLTPPTNLNMAICKGI